MSYRNHEDEIMMSPRIHVQPRVDVRGRSDQSPRSRSNQSQSPRSRNNQSPRSQSPHRASSRSPTRRVPSPLRNAEFRPLAMEYAKTPPVTSCKYFNDEEEPATPGGCCSAVRTVG